MTREEILEKLTEIFRDVLFEDGSILINDSTTAEDIEDWDSLEQINLIVAIEESFQIKFSMSEVYKMKNIGEMADAVMKKRSK